MWPFHHFDARDIRSQQPYWLLRNGIDDATAPLSEPVDCDVLIVGAGITGALIANELTHAKRNVVIIEHRDVALGSTSASTALLQYEIDTDLIDLIKKVGEPEAQRAYRAGVDSIAMLEVLAARERDSNVNFERRKSLYLASRSSHVKSLREEYAARAQAGLEVQWLDEAEVLDQYGCYRPGAILSSQGAQVDPFRMARALLHRSVAAGARLFGLTQLVKIESARGRLRLQTDTGFDVTAAHVIIACGYESLKFLPKKVAKLHSTYALVTDPVQAPGHAVDTALVWESARPYLYMRQTPDRRLLVGGQDAPFDNPSTRDAHLASKVKNLKSQYRSLFRQELPPVAYSWAGTFAETEDGLPLIGHAAGTPPQLLFALCFGGNGITFSAHAGAILRGLIEEEPHPLQSVFGFARLGF